MGMRAAGTPARHVGRWLPAVGLLVVSALAPAGARATADRPKPLPDQDGCDHYRGTASGNDPSVRFDVVLCPDPSDADGGKVQGKVQWSSLLSGWNLRRVEGRWRGDTLVLRDLEIIEERPEGGFYFCTIDRYALERGADGSLAGRYDSEACRDHAKVTLAPVETKAEAPGSLDAGVEPTGSASRERASEAQDPSTPRSDAGTPSPGGGCGCTPGLGFVLLPGGLMLGARRRRRRRSVP